MGWGKWTDFIFQNNFGGARDREQRWENAYERYVEFVIKDTNLIITFNENIWNATVFLSCWYVSSFLLKSGLKEICGNINVRTYLTFY